MEDVQKFPWMYALPSGGLHQRGNDAVRLYPVVRSCPEAHLAKDHYMPKRLLRMIVRGRHAGNAQEGEEMFLLRPDKVRPQSFGRFEAMRLLAYLREFPYELALEICRLFPEDLAGFQVLPRLAGP